MVENYVLVLSVQVCSKDALVTDLTSEQSQFILGLSWCLVV